MTFGDWSKTIDVREAAATEDVHISATILDAIEDNGLSIRETLRYLRTIIQRITSTPHATVLKVFDALKDILDGDAPPFVPHTRLFTTPPHGDSTVKRRACAARDIANAMLGIVAAAAGTKLIGPAVPSRRFSSPVPRSGEANLQLLRPVFKFPYPSYAARVAHVRELTQEAHAILARNCPGFAPWDAFFDTFNLQGDDRAAAQAAALAGAWPTVYVIIRNPTRTAPPVLTSSEGN